MLIDETEIEMVRLQDILKRHGLSKKWDDFRRRYDESWGKSLARDWSDEQKKNGAAPGIGKAVIWKKNIDSQIVATHRESDCQSTREEKTLCLAMITE